MQEELGDLDRKMGVELLELSAERTVGRMPVAGNTQVFGRLHGGATAALGELLASLASNQYGRARGMVAVGVDLNATHHRGVRSGHVTGVATPLHQGTRVCTYQVAVTDDAGALVSTIRLTTMLIAPAEG